MRECRSYGSVRGARSNARPYRDSLAGFPPQIDGAFIARSTVALIG